MASAVQNSDHPHPIRIHHSLFIKVGIIIKREGSLAKTLLKFVDDIGGVVHGATELQSTGTALYSRVAIDALVHFFLPQLTFIQLGVDEPV